MVDAGSQTVSGWRARAKLPEMLRFHALHQGDQTAFRFLDDGVSVAASLTWKQLYHRSLALAEVLCESGASGRHVLLALPSGLAFIESLFACWYAGAVAVPVSLPRHSRSKDRLQNIYADSSASFALCTSAVRKRLDAQDMSSLKWIAIDTLAQRLADGIAPSARSMKMVDQQLAEHQLAVLQYTSGSTGKPRGVMVTHANVAHNTRMIAQACGNREEGIICGWLPLFHDMGLIGLIGQAVSSGVCCILMPPERFLMRPYHWLKAISDYRCHSSVAPNFAYDLCVERVTAEQKKTLDLSCWLNALNGSEPLRMATLNHFTDAFAECGFGREKFIPCYGLAEATLLVAAAGVGRRIKPRSKVAGVHLAEEDNARVGCGLTYGDTRIAMVDPKTCRPVSQGEIGEIWVAGGSCAVGYWNDPVATEQTFNARMESALDASDQGNAEPKWLRTGDLGYIEEDNLFITGRLKELIIIAGRNHYPFDLERTVEDAESQIAPSGVAAFTADINGTEKLIIAAELRRETLPGRSGKQQPEQLQSDIASELETLFTQLRRRIRAVLATEHDLTPYAVVILRAGTLPRTTSGKICRRLAATEYQAGRLEEIARI